MPIRVFDFFCGCGGTSAGLQAAGMEIVMGLDFDPDSERTFRHNFPNAQFVSTPIEQVTVEALVPFLTYSPDEILLFSGCAPCQPFSKQNKNKPGSSIDDERFALLNEFGRFISRYLPHLIFMENVPGMQCVDSQDGPFSRFVALLTRLGYHLNYKLVDAVNYGVPQKRRRLVLVASRLGVISIPEPTHGPGRAIPRYSTVADWIAGLPFIEAGESEAPLPNHLSPPLSELNRRRMAATPPGGGRRDWPQELVLNCHSKGHDGHTDVYGRLSWDKPSITLTTRCTSLSNGRFGHPVENRAISAREAARLQTFDMNFRFFGTLPSTSRQIGNAVPVLMARRFGETFASHVESWRLGNLPVNLHEGSTEVGRR